MLNTTGDILVEEHLEIRDTILLVRVDRRIGSHMVLTQ
jgi:hypothetical protein